jgi:hypothetical protein
LGRGGPIIWLGLFCMMAARVSTSAPEDLEALEETLEIMRDAATMNRLAESDAELARGEYVSADELAEAMRQRQAR